MFIGRQQASKNISVEDLWGPNNYQDCFQVPQSNLYPEHIHYMKYELMNESGDNSLLFSLASEAIYVYQAKIVNPNFRLAYIW